MDPLAFVFIYLCCISSIGFRGHEKKLTKHATRSEVRQQFFSNNHVVNDWNGLDSTVAMAPSLDTFRKRLELSQK